MVTPWCTVENLVLTSYDKDCIMNSWLSDKHIQVAQLLIKQQFPGLAGLQPPSCLVINSIEEDGILCELEFNETPAMGLQVHLVNSNHWILSAFSEGKIQVTSITLHSFAIDKFAYI